MAAGCELIRRAENRREWGGDKVEVKAGRDGVEPFFYDVPNSEARPLVEKSAALEESSHGRRWKPRADRNMAAAALRRRGCGAAAARGTLYAEDKDC